MSRLPVPDYDTHRAAHGDYLTAARGIRSWLFTLDHKRIGLMYMVAVLTAFLIGGIFAEMLRTMLLSPKFTIGGSPTKAFELYNHMFTLHGAVMVFGFMIPAIPAILGNFVLPMMLGARDVAFPRLNLLSFWLYAIGLVFFLYILLGGVLSAGFGWQLPGGMGLDTGWTFYTPYSTSRSGTGVVPATLGAFVMGFSSILTGVNFVASIHMLRPRGMSWFKMPLFLWALYGTSILQILATPVLGITLLLLMAERVLKVGVFDSNLGGDPVLFQHFFWFYSHPAVYIMILPAMGIISELIAVFSRRHIFGYSFIAASSIAIAFFSFLVWGHHMFVSGQSNVANAIFSIFTFSVAIPSAIKVFNWLATLYGGDIRLKTPMLYALGFIVLFMIGGMTGLFLGSLATDVHLTNTYFIVAHFHYVMMGSTLFAFLGGMYYWWPKMFGKMYSEQWGRVAMLVVFIGFNLTFLVQFIAGSQGMPRRYASYPDKYHIHNIISTIGAYMMGLGLFMVLFNWLHALWRGEKAPANPWGGNTLEWRTPSPPPHHNFDQPPVGDDPYDLSGWQYDPQTGDWVREAESPATASPAH